MSNKKYMCNNKKKVYLTIIKYQKLNTLKAINNSLIDYYTSLLLNNKVLYLNNKLCLDNWNNLFSNN